MHREAAVAPGQEIADSLLRDQALVDQHPEHLGPEEPLDMLAVERRQGLKRALRCPTAIGQEDMDVGVEVEELAGGLEEADGAGDQPLGWRCSSLGTGPGGPPRQDAEWRPSGGRFSRKWKKSGPPSLERRQAVYGTRLDQAEVSPDSKPSVKIIDGGQGNAAGLEAALGTSPSSSIRRLKTLRA